MITYAWDNVIEKYDTPNILGARQCIIKTPTLEETNTFLNRFHFQGTCFGQDIRYGLYYNDELVGIMTFGKARFTNKVQYELLRLCYNAKYKVTGGSEKLFKTFLTEYHPNSVISYCDNSKFTGNVYLVLGMKKIQQGKPRKHFFRKADNKHFTMQQVLKYGVDNLLKTTYGKGKNNEELLIKEGFEVIFDEGQDAYLYLDENQYFGYIYLVTDSTNGKQYVGQHISSTFDPEYYGSGTYISRVIKERRASLKLEVLEWCKQDISERELYYIQKYNTLAPNGYNLTTRLQWFTYNKPEDISERQKAFYKTERGKEKIQRSKESFKKYLGSERWKVTKERLIQERKKFLSTDEGKEWQKQKAKRYSEYCKTDAGKEMCSARNKKLVELHKTEKGKASEKKRIDNLRNFYQTEAGKLAKQKQILAYKANAKTPEGIRKKALKAKHYSEWAHTKEGQLRLKESAQKTRQALINKYTAEVNAMTEIEWEKYLKEHPRTALKKYRINKTN